MSQRFWPWANNAKPSGCFSINIICCGDRREAAMPHSARIAETCTFKISTWSWPWVLSTLRYKRVKKVRGSACFLWRAVDVTWSTWVLSWPIASTTGNSQQWSIPHQQWLGHWTALVGCRDACRCSCGSRTVRIMCVLNQKCRAGAAFLHHCACDHAPNGRWQMVDGVINNYKPLRLQPLECNISHFIFQAVNTMLPKTVNDPSRILPRGFE